MTLEPTLNEARDETSAASRRLEWRCRRGMLELDLVFNEFVKHDLHQMNHAQMAALDKLLDLPDNELWSLVLQPLPDVDVNTAAVLAMLRTTNSMRALAP